MTIRYSCGEGCHQKNMRYWTPNSIYNIECKCGELTEFFKDEKSKLCSKCGDRIINSMVGKDCC
jgi:hypothetical protein